MDNDPSQNSEVAQATLKELNCELVAIPPCSPDLNPIENSFHITKSSAENDGIEYQVCKESFKHFTLGVFRTLGRQAKMVFHCKIDPGKRANTTVEHGGLAYMYFDSSF